MRELSRYLMVTGGNVTGLTDELEQRRPRRRARRARATAAPGSCASRRKGRRRFEAMAREHERWILELFAGLDAAGAAALRPARPLRVHLVRERQATTRRARQNVPSDRHDRRYTPRASTPALARRQPHARSPATAAKHFRWAA